MTGLRMARALWPGGLLTLALLAGCVSTPKAPPAPPRAQPPPPPPPQVKPSPILPWDVAPVAAGNWRYRQDGDGTVAIFAGPGGDAQLSFRCRPGARQISISRIGGVVAPGTLFIRTSAGDLRWSAAPTTDVPLAMIVTRPASDAGFDWIAFSRGRIAVELVGVPRLIVPAWAEVARVIEDCRG